MKKSIENKLFDKAEKAVVLKYYKKTVEGRAVMRYTLKGRVKQTVQLKKWHALQSEARK